MAFIELPTLSIFFLPALLCLSALFFISIFPNTNSSKPPHEKPPTSRSYPLIGSLIEIFNNRNQIPQWTSTILQKSPTSTHVLRDLVGGQWVLTSNPSNVHHILKTNFHKYHKGETVRNTFSDLFGDGILTADGATWKLLRQLAGNVFNSKAFRKFDDTVIETELSSRLIPILSAAAENKTVLDLQDIFERFTFDIIFQLACGVDVEYLAPSLPNAELMTDFDLAVSITSERYKPILPLIWKTKRVLNIGSEKKLRLAAKKVHESVKQVIEEKKREFKENPTRESADLLWQLFRSGKSDDVFLRDTIINFLLAGRDTTSSALTWFFWLISKNPEVEIQILKEMKEQNSEESSRVYMHALLCESMRLFPPGPIVTKEAKEEDLLPDGTKIKKGTSVVIHIYAMGRSEKLWGPDWAEFRPERWLEREAITGKKIFVGRDAHAYPVFLAGAWLCLGRETAFLQMKSVVGSVLRRFRVVPVVEDGSEPVLVSGITSRMKGGFPVRIEARADCF